MKENIQLAGSFLLAFVFIPLHSSPHKNICVDKYGGNCAKYEDCPGKVIPGYSCGDQLVCCAPPPRIKREDSISEIKCAEYSENMDVYEEDISGDEGYEKINTCVKSSGEVRASGYGGEDAELGEFTFMALIGYNNDNFISWLCGGSLISPKFILSAAHCSFHRDLGPAKWVLLGDLNVSTTEDGADPQLLQIKKRINHPDYNSETKYNDIALYELSTEVTFNSNVRPLCLHNSHQLDELQEMTVLGWGETETEPQSAHLQKIKVFLTDERICKSNYDSITGLPSGFEWDKMFCAGGGPRNSCKGDSGGPIVIRSKYYCTHSVIGVTSFGTACTIGGPGVYTRVSNYIKWIEGEVWPN